MRESSRTRLKLLQGTFFTAFCKKCKRRKRNPVLKLYYFVAQKSVFWLGGRVTHVALFMLSPVKATAGGFGFRSHSTLCRGQKSLEALGEHLFGEMVTFQQRDGGRLRQNNFENFKNWKECVYICAPGQEHVLVLPFPYFSVRAHMREVYLWDKIFCGYIISCPTYKLASLHLWIL